MLDTQKLHNCQECKRKFQNLPGLLIHIKYFHKNKNQIKINPKPKKSMGDELISSGKSINSTSLKCKLCTKMFSNKYTLNAHIATIHEKTTKFQCPICQKCFSRSNAISDHINSVHEKLKPHKCSFCAKSFSLIGNLKKHTNRVH